MHAIICIFLLYELYVIYNRVNNVQANNIFGHARRSIYSE